MTSRTVVRATQRLRTTESHSDRPRSGRPRKNTPELQARVLTKLSQTDRPTVRRIRRELAAEGVRVGKTTINVAAREAGWRSLKPVRKPRLSDEQKTKRLEWARRHLNDSPETVRRMCFSDEKYFTLDGTSARVWCAPGQPPPVQRTGHASLPPAPLLALAVILGPRILSPHWFDVGLSTDLRLACVCVCAVCVFADKYQKKLMFSGAISFWGKTKLFVFEEGARVDTDVFLDVAKEHTRDLREIFGTDLFTYVMVRGVGDGGVCAVCAFFCPPLFLRRPHACVWCVCALFGCAFMCRTTRRLTNPAAL